VEPLDIVSSAGEAAFASNEKGLIVLWNRFAKDLLGQSDGDVLGRPCFEVIGGLDAFGNLYCRGDCNVHRMVRCQKAVRPFEIRVRKLSGELIRATLRILSVRVQQPSRYLLIHSMHPILPDGEVDHEIYPAPSIADLPAAESPRDLASDSHRPSTVLTRREREVLALLASGGSTHDISGNLCISNATVRNHVQHILRKLAAHSKLEAVYIAHRNRLI
jgi:DNA-binding CsgD family transcriptional regulator